MNASEANNGNNASEANTSNNLNGTAMAGTTTSAREEGTSKSNQTRPLWKKTGFRIGALVVVALVLGAALVFKPWLLFIDQRVDDAIPDVVATSTTSAMAPEQGGKMEKADGMSAMDAMGAMDSGKNAANGPALVAQGNFISHEHSTTGTASIVKDAATGKSQLVLSDLNTSNGPDVHVWLSKAPVIEGQAGWFVAGEHEHVDLGQIKGNVGNQVYDLPSNINVDDWTSVVLWCDDFNVSFGAAALGAT